MRYPSSLLSEKYLHATVAPCVQQVTRLPTEVRQRRELDGTAIVRVDKAEIPATSPR